jgi:hypothetical protein
MNYAKCRKVDGIGNHHVKRYKQAQKGKLWRADYEKPMRLSKARESLIAFLCRPR